MHRLTEDLQNLADAIVSGRERPARTWRVGAHYSVATALAIYRHNYYGNLQEALAGAYPVVEQIVGKPFFRRITRHYVEQHPSRSGDLHVYGEEMAAFLARFSPAQELPYLQDMAALEWACHRAYFAADLKGLDIIRLSRVSCERYPDLTLRVHPACCVVRSPYPIARIWHAHQPGAPREFHIDLASGPCIALVSCQTGTVHVSELSEAELVWLNSLREGVSLGWATDATLEQFPEFELQAALMNVVSKNVVTDFALREAHESD